MGEGGWFCGRRKNDEQRPVHKYPGTEAQPVREHPQLYSVSAGLRSLPPCQEGHGLVQARYHHLAGNLLGLNPI